MIGFRPRGAAGRHPLLTILIDGLLVIVPLGAVALLVVGILRHLRDATAPLSGEFVHPMVSGVALFLLVCFLVGFAVRSAVGRMARRALEAALFEKIPGYRLAKAVASEGPLMGDTGKVRPAFVSMEDGQCPALVVDELSDGRFVIFVPGSPAPMSGTLYIFTPDKVELLDVPLVAFVQAVSSWGFGIRQLLDRRRTA